MTRGTCLQCKRPDLELVRIRVSQTGLHWCCEPCLVRWDAMGLDFTRVPDDGERVTERPVAMERRRDRGIRSLNAIRDAYERLPASLQTAGRR